MENLESLENNKYYELKQLLIGGKISFIKLREILLEFDQSTSDRRAAKENKTFLLDPEVSAVLSNNEESKYGYYRFLGFTEFHIAQQAAITDSEKCVDYLKKSIEFSTKGNSEDGWLAYLEGTLLYVEGQTIPESVISRVTSVKNKDILRRLNSGLENRGKPSYSEDYFNSF